MPKVVILAGGLGTRISEETGSRPKPMVEIGGKPILWHIMKIYSHAGYREFIICLGYKGYVVKEYFQNYFLHTSDVTFDVKTNSMEVHRADAEDWRITLVDTGSDTQTGGRIKRILNYIPADDEYFLMTYGDGVADIDVADVVAHHSKRGLLATVCAAQPPGRFGSLSLVGDLVEGFREKPSGDGGWVNCGYFVLSPKVGALIEGDQTVWEQQPLEALASMGQLSAYTHDGFWQPMDTLRDKNKLEDLWMSGEAKWKLWT